MFPIKIGEYSILAAAFSLIQPHNPPMLRLGRRMTSCCCTAAGTDNNKDPAEPYRLHDGYDDQGLGEDGVMTLEVGRGPGLMNVVDCGMQKTRQASGCSSSKNNVSDPEMWAHWSPRFLSDISPSFHVLAAHTVLTLISCPHRCPANFATYRHARQSARATPTWAFETPRM